MVSVSWRETARLSPETMIRSTRPCSYRRTARFRRRARRGEGPSFHTAAPRTTATGRWGAFSTSWRRPRPASRVQSRGANTHATIPPSAIQAPTCYRLSHSCCPALLRAPRDGVFRIRTGAGSAAEDARPLGGAFVTDPYCGALSGAGDDEVRGRRVGQGVHVCTQSTEPGRVEVDLGRGSLRQDQVTGAPVAHQVDLGDRCGKTGFSEIEACGAEPVVDLDAGGGLPVSFADDRATLGVDHHRGRGGGACALPVGGGSGCG